VAKPKRLVEGVDYYMEDGKMVLTAHFLLERGFCCNSGCRHCPYGDQPAATVGVAIVGLPARVGASPEGVPTGDGESR
jgi:hypothetical protein